MTQLVGTGTYVRFNVDLTSLDQFYAVVHWLNGTVGKGKHNWTSYGPIRKHIVKNGSHTGKFVVTNDILSEEDVAAFIAKI